MGTTLCVNATMFNNISGKTINSKDMLKLELNHSGLLNTGELCRPTEEIIYYQEFQAPSFFLAIMTSLNVAIFLVGIIGNILVIAVLQKNRSLFETTGLFLLNLAVADLLVISFAQPTAMMELFTQEIWYLGETMCKLVPFLENSATNVSILTVLVISLERYISICHPFRPQNRWFKERQGCTLLALWILAMLMSIPLIFITTYKHSEFYDGSLVPVCRSTVRDGWKQCYIVGKIILMYIVPAVMFAYLYSSIIRRLAKDLTPANMENDDSAFKDSNPRPNSVTRARRKVVIMLIVMIALLFVCVLPFRVVSLWMIFASKINLRDLGIVGYLCLLHIPRVLVYLHSAVNPILYNVMSRRFRLALLRLLPTKPECMQMRENSKSRLDVREMRNSMVRGL